MNKTILEWDSNFFGFGVARISQAEEKDDGLSQTLFDLKQKNVRLVYFAIPPGDKIYNDAAKKNGGLLVDVKRTYERAYKAGFERFSGDNHIELYESNLLTDGLISLSLQAGIYSRYKTDVHFSDTQYQELYTLWIKNSVNKSIADKVFVYREPEDINRLLTLAFKKDHAEIGLVSVDERYRGKKIGSALLETAISESFSISFPCRVVTQKANTAACALYEKYDFRLIDEDNFYHFWL